MVTRYALLLTIAPVLLVGCCGSPTINDAGGVRLVYEIDEEALANGTGNAGVYVVDLQTAISRRLQSLGEFGVEVVPIDESSVEVSIGGAKRADLAEIKRVIGTFGDWALIMVANSLDDESLIEAASASDEQLVLNEFGDEVGRWTNISTSSGVGLPVSPEDALRAKNQDGEYVPIAISDDQHRRLSDDSLTTAKLLAELQLSQPQVLLRVDPNRNRRVTGAFLRSASVGTDNIGRRAVRFYMSAEGAKRLMALSSKNLPDPQTDFHRRLAIVFNGEVISSPQLNDVISDTGIITGEFTQDDVRAIVVLLNAGRMPVRLKPEPIRETWVAPP